MHTSPLASQQREKPPAGGSNRRHSGKGALALSSSGVLSPLPFYTLSSLHSSSPLAPSCLSLGKENSDQSAHPLVELGGGLERQWRCMMTRCTVTAEPEPSPEADLSQYSLGSLRGEKLGHPSAILGIPRHTLPIHP